MRRIGNPVFRYKGPLTEDDGGGFTWNAMRIRKSLPASGEAIMWHSLGRGRLARLASSIGCGGNFWMRDVSLSKLTSPRLEARLKADGISIFEAKCKHK